MKVILSIICALVITSCVVTQQGEGKYMMQGTYNFTFSDEVRIQIGGASKSQSSSDWQNGSTVGNHTIDGNTFNELQSATSDKFLFKIESKGLNNVHKITAKNIASGKTINGTYNYNSKMFSFLSASGGQNNSQVGAMEVGVLKGKFANNFSSIDNGEYSIGWIVGKVPVIITADATFFFNGKK